MAIDNKKLSAAGVNLWGWYIVGCLAVVVAIFLYATHITGDLYGDEYGHTMSVVTREKFWRGLLDPSMCHPPLYFILSKVAYEAVGALWAVRIPSFISAIGAVLLAGVAAARILGKEYTLTALWVAALSPFMLEFAAEGRAYAMLMFFSLAFLIAFEAFLRKETAVTLLLLVTTACGGALTHYFFCFQLVAAAMYYLAKRRRVTVYSILAALIVGILLAGFLTLLFIFQKAGFRQNLQVNYQKEYFHTMNFLGRVAIAISSGYCTFRLPSLGPARNVPLQAVFSNIALVIPFCLWFAGFAYACARLLLLRKEKMLFLISLASIPVFLGVFMANAGFFLIREKHLASIWAPYLMLVVLAVHYLVKTMLGRVCIACYIVVIAISIIHYVFLPNEYSRRMDWTGLNSMIAADVAATDCIVAYGSTSSNRLSLLSNEGDSIPCRQINVAGYKKRGKSLTDLARELSDSSEGRIFLIVDETDRNLVDPNNHLIRELRKEHDLSIRQFGRNLNLYIFTAIQKPVVSGE